MLRYGLFSYWLNSYWGGATAALGGALLLGALPRIRLKPDLGAGLALGTGVSLLAVTRPYEGLVLSIVAAAYLATIVIRKGLDSLRTFIPRTAIPAACIVVLAAGGLGYYNWRVTGRPLVLPYQINQQAYGWPMTLGLFEIHQVKHRHKQMADYYAWEQELHEKLIDPLDNAFDNSLDLVSLWSFFIGPALTVPLVAGRRLFQDRRIRFLVITAGAMILTVALEQTRVPHYMAPATVVWLALAMQGMRHLYNYRTKGRNVGRAVTRLLLVSVFVVAIVSLGNRILGVNYSPYIGYHTSVCCSRPGNLARTEIQDRLLASPGQDLVLVRYGPEHDPLYEWVYNRASIDTSEIIWARDMGPEKNRSLLEYFADRNTWLLHPDQEPPSLEPYQFNNP